MMTSQEVKVRRETVEACMKCPLCNKLLKDATTISECLHTFCRKCIYEKLTDEEVDCCPKCKIDLGSVPVEKLRPDHNLQDIRSKIFPSKRRKVKAAEDAPSISLPIRRKERSLSSLVVSTPRVSTQTNLTGRRTKAVARKASTLRGSSFSVETPIKKEEDVIDDQPQSSSSPETLNKIAQNKRQNSSIANQYNHFIYNKDTDIGDEARDGKVDIWKPLNCLVEAANRTKSSKFHSRGPSGKSETPHGSKSELLLHRGKIREQGHKSKVQSDKIGTNSPLGFVKSRKLHGMRRKREGSYRERGTTTQAILDSDRFKWNRSRPIWFTLLASEDQEGIDPLPQISASYLRIRDGNLPISFVQKYLVKKLNLSSEAEVEITCQGQPVVPTLQLHDLMDLWLQSAPMTPGVSTVVGNSAKDFVMVLAYGRKVRPP